jgi:hypothetical protein
MRIIFIFAISALLVVATTGPTMARDYPWCGRTSVNGFLGGCDFSTYQQCMATVSGQFGDCVRNPLFGYRQDPRRRNGSPNPGSWQNGWDNRW